MPHSRSFVIVACVFAPLLGCASYKPAPISPVENGRALDSRSLENPRLQKFIGAELGNKGKADPPPTWDLSTLTLAAIYYHPDIAIAHAKLAGAEAGVITAAQIPNPSLSFEDLHYNATVAAWTAAPVINFVIETFGKREARTAQAQHLANAAVWDLATAGWQVRGGVRMALLNLWAAQHRLDLSRQRLELQDQLVGLLEQRFAVGEASSLDVMRERIARRQITFAIRSLERGAAGARAELATAIGVPVRALDSVGLLLEAFDHPPPIPAHPDTGELRREALTKRTDVQASLQEYEAAQASLKFEVAKQYPNITLSPGYIYDAGTNSYLLLPAFDLPVFNQNQGPIAQALANRKQASATFTALQARIIGVIDEAATAYRTATRSVATGDALRADDEHRARQIESQFRAGQLDRVMLVTAELGVAATALSRFDAVVQQRQAIGALEDALQQPLLDPGHWPVVPEQDPGLSHSESSS
jgi:cobalt-zinc-cadmium efflux system outer membrane protein